MALENWANGIYGLVAAIEKKLLPHTITFNENVRKRSLEETKKVVAGLKKARAEGDVNDEVIFLRDVLMGLHSTLVDQVQGVGTLQENGEFLYDERDAKFCVKKLLEAGADTKALFFPIFEDDDEESLWRISLNCLKYGVTMYPLYFDGEKRSDENFDEINPVYFKLEDIYDQTYTLGEIATIYCYRPVPDIIAMMIRADADFMVRDSKNHEGVHALVRILQKDFDIHNEDAALILDAYKQVYLNKNNKLTAEQRQGIVDVMKSCLDEKNPVSESISPENKELVQETLTSMLNVKSPKMVNREK